MLYVYLCLYIQRIRLLHSPGMNFTHLEVVVFLLKMHGSHLHNFFPLKTGLMLHEVELQGCDDSVVGKSPTLLTEEPILVET